MNKVFIRNRQIDNNKQLPIITRDNDDLADFNEYSNINRGSQILSGMDKGEESEHHFLEALRELEDVKIITRAIPIPEVVEDRDYISTYECNFKLPKQYIRVKILDLEDELPEYDMDQADEYWLEKSNLDITRLKFEQIIENFERASTQKTLLLDEAKSLLRQEAVNVVTGVYDYWLSKRVKVGQPLILSVKADRVERTNNAPIDPYVAFRKRSEKMTTRKNRRVDEASYEKMFRLRLQMEKLSEIIQLISKRESLKCDKIRNEKEVFKKRFDCKDYDKLQLKESETLIKRQSIKLSENFKSAQRSREENQKENKRKRSHQKSVDVLLNISDQNHINDDDDYSFRPMLKCKYLPSIFSSEKLHGNSNRISVNLPNHNTSDINLQHHQNHSQNQDPSLFSLSNLCHLSESKLRNINVPIRYRMNKDHRVVIDLEHCPDDPNILSQLNIRHNHDSNKTAKSLPTRQSLEGILQSIRSLSSMDIYSGLKPLSMPLSFSQMSLNCANFPKKIPLDSVYDHPNSNKNHFPISETSNNDNIIQFSNSNYQNNLSIPSQTKKKSNQISNSILQNSKISNENLYNSSSTKNYSQTTKLSNSNPPNSFSSNINSSLSPSSYSSNVLSNNCNSLSIGNLSTAYHESHSKSDNDNFNKPFVDSGVQNQSTNGHRQTTSTPNIKVDYSYYHNYYSLNCEDVKKTKSSSTSPSSLSLSQTSVSSSSADPSNNIKLSLNCLKSVTNHQSENSDNIEDETHDNITSNKYFKSNGHNTVSSQIATAVTTNISNTNTNNGPSTHLNNYTNFINHNYNANTTTTINTNTNHSYHRTYSSAQFNNNNNNNNNGNSLSHLHNNSHNHHNSHHHINNHKNHTQQKSWLTVTTPNDSCLKHSNLMSHVVSSVNKIT